MKILVVSSLRVVLFLNHFCIPKLQLSLLVREHYIVFRMNE